jgi:hypothetical protein
MSLHSAQVKVVSILQTEQGLFALYGSTFTSAIILTPRAGMLILNLLLVTNLLDLKFQLRVPTRSKLQSHRKTYRNLPNHFSFIVDEVMEESINIT